MEVTRENFEKVLEELPDVFKNAQFIAFDTEYTGLKVEGSSNINYFDTLEDLYEKDRLKVETFMAIQFGVVAFFYNKETNKYTHQGYNFYVYPSSYSNVNFTCQSSSIKFLIEHDFDFNKLFKHGIPYLKEQELEQLLKKLEEKHDKNLLPEKPSKCEIPNEHKETVNGIIKKAQEILSKGDKKCFQTEKYNSFVRRLIYNSLQQEFGYDILIETNKDETMTVSVGFSAEEIKEKKKEKFLQQQKEIMDEVGFCKVIKLIMEANKLLIGHNLLCDILFTIRQFLVPLPNSYVEFKELVKFLFPKIIDTKHMAAVNMKNVKDTALHTLFNYLKELEMIPEVEVNKNGTGYKLEDEKFHEASYDAYLTGLCFLGMSKYLGNSKFDNLPELPLLKPILNKLSTPKLCDIFFMNLGGADNEPDRLGVYHLTFPKEWNRQNITDLFKNCGFINISWLNSTSAFVRVNKEFIPEVEKNLMLTNSNYKLVTHSEFKSSNSNISDALLSPVTEKRSQVEISENNFSPIKSVSNNIVKKRKVEEDIGEVIERKSKKSC